MQSRHNSDFAPTGLVQKTHCGCYKDFVPKGTSPALAITIIPQSRCRLQTNTFF